MSWVVLLANYLPNATEEMKADLRCERLAHPCTCSPVPSAGTVSIQRRAQCHGRLCPGCEEIVESRRGWQQVLERAPRVHQGALPLTAHAPSRGEGLVALAVMRSGRVPTRRSRERACDTLASWRLVDQALHDPSSPRGGRHGRRVRGVRQRAPHGCRAEDAEPIRRRRARQGSSGSFGRC